MNTHNTYVSSTAVKTIQNNTGQASHETHADGELRSHKRESIHTGLKERADLHAANHACAGRRSPERRLWGIHFRKVCNTCEWLILRLHV